MVWFNKKHRDYEDVQELQETIAVLKLIAINLRITANEFEKQIEALKEANQASSKEGI